MCHKCIFYIIFKSSFWKHSIQFSHSVVSDSLRPHELQHARPPCPSPTPGVHSDSRPSTQWCHPAISSSVVAFSSCPQSFPASGSFPMSQLFAWGGQSIGVAASASVLPMNTQDWSPLGWTGWISLQSKGLTRHYILLIHDSQPSGSGGKKVCLQGGRPGFNLWVGKISWRRGMATHSIILAWRISWAEEPGGLYIVHGGHKESDMIEWLSLSYNIYLYMTPTMQHYGKGKTMEKKFEVARGWWEINMWSTQDL